MTSKTYRATLIEGDGIGPEITDSTVRILENWVRLSPGKDVQAGSARLNPAVSPCRSNAGKHLTQWSDLKGPLTTPVGKGFKSVNVTLRQRFGLYANLRPTRTVIPGGRFDHIDLVVVREKYRRALRRQ